MFTEITGLLELPAKSQHERFDVMRGAVAWTCRRCRLAVPVDAIQSLPARASHPSLDDRQTDAKRACHFAHAAASTYPLDHSLAALRDTI